MVAMGGLSGCVGSTGAKTSTGNAGVLSGSVATVAFGNVGVSKTATQSFTITNTGTATVNLGQSSITGTGFTIASGSLAGSVGVGQSVTVQIQFAPLTAAAASGSFTMVSDASNSPFSVALSGTGTQPGLASAPAARQFRKRRCKEQRFCNRYLVEYRFGERHDRSGERQRDRFYDRRIDGWAGYSAWAKHEFYRAVLTDIRWECQREHLGVQQRAEFSNDNCSNRNGNATAD